MTFYVDHTRPVPFARRLDCSKKCAMAKEGIDLDMKLRSGGST